MTTTTMSDPALMLRFMFASTHRASAGAEKSILNYQRVSFSSLERLRIKGFLKTNFQLRF